MPLIKVSNIIKMLARSLPNVRLLMEFYK